jgi:DNA-binding SARP family transcriptional activator
VRYDISLLGPLEVRRDGEPVVVPGGKTAELLVRLALEAGTFVPAHRLLDDLWAGAPTTRNTLQQKVARLRAVLPGVIESGEAGYRLAVAPEAVDAHRVLYDKDDALLGDLRGELIPAAGDWAAAHRTQLEEARVIAVERRFAARLRLGRTRSASSRRRWPPSRTTSVCGSC